MQEMIMIPRSPFQWHGLTLIPAWINDYIHYNVWDGIIYPFTNFNCCTVEVWKWISNFICHVIGQVITYPCWSTCSPFAKEGVQVSAQIRNTTVLKRKIILCLKQINAASCLSTYSLKTLSNECHSHTVTTYFDVWKPHAIRILG